MTNLARTLVAGDRVAIVSPASFAPKENVDELIATLRSWGLVPEVGAHAFDEHGYMAGPDQVRLSDMNAALRDPEIRAVVTTRGGAGAYRIADQLDFDALRSDPKPIIGYSDISYLHLAAWFHTRTSQIHGCLVGQVAQATTRQLLMSNEPILVQRDPQAEAAAVEVSGSASGCLIGGNLPALATSVGVRLPSLDGNILFIESPKAPGLGTVDRQLTQLIKSGALAGIAGIALGSFEAFKGHEDRGWTIVDVLADRLVPLGVPILAGIPAGHDVDAHSSIPLGTVAQLDTTSGTLTLDAPTTPDKRHQGGRR